MTNQRTAQELINELNIPAHEYHAFTSWLFTNREQLNRQRLHPNGRKCTYDREKVVELYSDSVIARRKDTPASSPSPKLNNADKCHTNVSRRQLAKALRFVRHTARQIKADKESVWRAESHAYWASEISKVNVDAACESANRAFRLVVCFSLLFVAYHIIVYFI